MNTKKIRLGALAGTFIGAAGLSIEIGTKLVQNKDKGSKIIGGTLIVGGGLIGAFSVNIGVNNKISLPAYFITGALPLLGLELAGELDERTELICKLWVPGKEA